jgi:hypothetical protein
MFIEDFTDMCVGGYAQDFPLPYNPHNMIIVLLYKYTYHQE